VAICATVSPLIGAIFSLPPLIGVPLRTLLMALPRAWGPKPEEYGGAAEIHPGDADSPARVLRTFQDPDGRDVGFVTGVTEREGKLYLGSLHSDYVGVLSLD